MGRTPTAPGLGSEAFQDAPEWFVRYLEAVKPFHKDLATVLAGNIGNENLSRQVIATTLQTGTTPEATFATGNVAVKHNLGRTPRSLTIAQIRLDQPGAAYASESWQVVASTSFLNGWTNYDTAVHNSAAYWKDPMGVVHLRGVIMSGTFNTDATGQVFLLPAGFRPARHEVFAAASSSLGEARVYSTGYVHAVGGNNSYFSLDGMSFRASVGAPGIAPTLPQWETTQNGQIRIRYIAGLAPNTKYHITYVLE